MSATASPRSTSSATFRRRRLTVLLVLVVLLVALGAATGGIGAQAELDDPVAGHAVVAPGETLWEVAVDSAPAGVDPRAQLEAIREMNGLDGTAVDAWTVLLLPAR